MIVGVAQTRSIKGDVASNIFKHKRLIELAASVGAAWIIFPELSVTGYEPDLAQALAVSIDNPQLNVFQELANQKHLSIGVGMPIKAEDGIYIGLVIFQPNQPRKLYAKKYLHADEFPYFVPGPTFSEQLDHEGKIAPAICYEISVPEHAREAYQQGAEIYIASVAKSVAGIKKAETRLSNVAREYKMTVLMANCIGYCDNFEAGGKSSIWDTNGSLLAQLNDQTEGLILLDTAASTVQIETLPMR